MALKDAYTIQEVVPLLGVTRQGLEKRAAREGWQFRPRHGRGGGKEWLVASMPEETQLAIRAAEEKNALAAVDSALPAPQLSPLTATAIMDDARRYKALAKADLLHQYLAWQRRFGATKAQKAAFIETYRAGAWPELLKELGPISWQSLERWKLEQERAGSVLALADKRGVAHRGRTLLTERHKGIILGFALQQNQAGITECTRAAQELFRAQEMFIPSEPTIRRFLKKFSTESFAEWTKFREGKKAWNDKCLISILRDWSLVEVGDVVVADGHTLNFESIDPDTGKPKRMTLVLFFDMASNCPLGWQIMATENTACISAAFRRTCIVLGKFPRVVYLDNGRAFRGKYFEGCADFGQAGLAGAYESFGCKVSDGGLYGDLGIKTTHAWSYHGQSKPIERFFRTMHELEVWVPSYTGSDIAHKPARMKRNETLHQRIYEKSGGRALTLEETHYAVARWFAEYMNRPQYRTHLHGKTPGEVFNAGRGPGLSEADKQRLVILMMQKEVRSISKDGIRVNGRLYWDEKLSNRRHPVLVRYDEYLDPYNVYVFTLEGEPLCTARDREHYRIACGVHPMAAHLGTPEQQTAFREAVEFKKGLEKASDAPFKRLLDTTVFPASQANAARHAMNTTAQPVAMPTAPKARPLPAAPAPTPEEEAAFEAKKAEAIAAMKAAPAYTPAALKRWRDMPEKYAYLFRIKYEQAIELIADDAAWMEAYERTPEYERYLKNRYDGLRGIYERERANAASA